MNPLSFTRLHPDGLRQPVDRAVPQEIPIAVEYDGVGYAVLMASGSDLDDLLTGFSLSERIIDRADQLGVVDAHRTDRGIILRTGLAPACADRVLDRVRHRVSDSSCGLCGIDNLEQALRPLPRLPDRPAPSSDALFRALEALSAHQPINRATGAVHAAAQCSADGAVLTVREDVGRHNAFDKLIGAMARAGTGWNGGFALLTSRCSYELVEKAVLADCPMLVTISAATGLAIERAAAANLPLMVLARPDAMLLAPGR